VLNFEKPNRNGEHPTMKPVNLFSYQLQNNTKEEDTVLDVFGGSGTTLIACEQTNRKCYMMELDEKYATVIIKRYIELVKNESEVYVMRENKKINYNELVKGV
jgi:DNA modification methylase